MMKKVLFISSLSMILLCFFLPLAYGCKDLLVNGDMSYHAVSGQNYPPYYAGNFFLGLILIIGFTGKGTWAKIVVFILLGAGLLAVLSLLLLMLAGFGRPCGISPSIWFALLFVSQVTLIIFVILKLFTTQKTKVDDRFSDF